LPREIVVSSDGMTTAIYGGGTRVHFPSLAALLAHHRLTEADLEEAVRRG
jgi:hypothetical protein